MISTRRVFSYLIGIATLTPLYAAHAQTLTIDDACKTYFCMLDPKVAGEPTCQPFVQEVFNTFAEGSHTVTCGSRPENLPAMNVTHRKAGKDFCRPDLRTDKEECNAEAVIDISLKGALYTRQWKLKVGAPSTEYYKGTSVPNYTPLQGPPKPDSGVIPPGPKKT